jgi:hypothetical protein
VGAGALAGGVALGLDDEAASMLRSSPTHALDRLGHRLTVLVPASMAAAAALVVTDRLFVPGPSAIPAVTAITALVAVGLAVQMWWSRRWADTAAEGAAAVVTAWALASLLAPDLLFLHRFAGAWRTHAHWVLGLSVVLVITGLSSGDRCAPNQPMTAWKGERQRKADPPADTHSRRSRYSSVVSSPCA